MKANEITREQVLDALSTHKVISKATKALGIKHQEMMKLMRQYGIVVNHNTKGEAVPDHKVMSEKSADEAHRWKVLYDQAIEANKMLVHQRNTATKSRDYFHERMNAYEEGTQWLLKYTPWLRRRWNKKFGLRTAPWATRNIMAINEKRIEHETK